MEYRNNPTSENKGSDMIKAFRVIARLEEDLTELQAQIESETGSSRKLQWVDKANTTVHELSIDLAHKIADNTFGDKSSIRDWAEILLHLCERDPNDVCSTLTVRVCRAIVKCDDKSKFSLVV